MTHSGMLYRLDISAFYFYKHCCFYEPLVFYPWKFMKNLSLPLSSITSKVNSHADNHFYILVVNIVQYEIISRGSSHESFTYQLAYCLNVFDHFMVVVLKWLSFLHLISNGLNSININPMT